MTSFSVAPEMQLAPDQWKWASVATGKETDWRQSCLEEEGEEEMEKDRREAEAQIEVALADQPEGKRGSEKEPPRKFSTN